jgi:hypothetical protein
VLLLLLLLEHTAMLLLLLPEGASASSVEPHSWQLAVAEPPVCKDKHIIKL